MAGMTHEYWLLVPRLQLIGIGLAGKIFTLEESGV